ncbi:18141_t:CDS:2, partial [Funneliformis geosporum]
LEKIDNSALRQRIVYLPSHPYFFNTGLGDNVVYPENYQENIHKEKLEKVAKKLGIKELVDKLPNQKGQNLSGGQKQLISLMRALVKDYEVYLFDEFLSNISNSIAGVSEKKWVPSFKVFDKVVVEKFSSVELFLWFMAGMQVKKDLMKKLFRLEGTLDRKKALALFNHDARLFGYNLVFFPNQIYYVILSSGLGFYFVSKAGGSLKDSKLRQISEAEIKKEDTIINSRDLIIKKGLVTSFQKQYESSVNQTISFTNKRDLTYTLYWVVPSFSLITYADFIFLPLVLGKGKEALTAMKMFGKVFGGGKKSIERARDYPYYFSAKKRLNNFLNLPERDDIQKNILISNPITNITLKKVSFAYEKKKPVLKKLDCEFQIGKINHLAGENG